MNRGSVLNLSLQEFVERKPKVAPYCPNELVAVGEPH